MLEEFFILNEVTSEKEVSDPRGMGYVATVLQEIYSMLGANDADDCRNRWRQIMIGLELETDLGVLGIKTIEDIELIVSSVNIERLRNNPVVIDESGIIEALSKRV